MNVFKQFLQQYWLLLLFILFKCYLQVLAINPFYELQRDEFLHLDQAKHLALGFISVPPLTAVFSKIIMLLGGDVFWIRSFPTFFGVLTLIYVWKTVEILGGKNFAKILALGAFTFSGFVRMNILFQPNSFEILIWTVAFYFLIKYLLTCQITVLYSIAIALAIGFYNKYNIVFLITGILFGIVVTSERKLISKNFFWKAILLFIILILPNAIWQAVHQFPVIHHMKALHDYQLVNNSAMDFISFQLRFSMGSLIVVIGGIAALFFHKPFRDIRVIGFILITILLLFTLAKAKDYYAFGIYPIIFAIGSVWLEQVLNRRVAYIVIPGLFILNLAGFMFVFKTVMPVYKPATIKEHRSEFERLGMLRWEDGKNHELPQDFADMLGWKEMADKAFEAYSKVPENEREFTIIHCDNYGQAGAVNYYNRKRKIPEAFAFNTDYIFWMPQGKTIKNVILVGDKPDPEILQMFSECIEIGKVENADSREKGTPIFLLKGAKPELQKAYYGEKQRRIKNFDIF